MRSPKVENRYPKRFAIFLMLPALLFLVGATEGWAQGPVAAYSFDAGMGTTIADSSGNGNNGTIGNATWSTAGKYGGALTLNGTNAFASINDSTSLHLTAGMTLEAWVNPSTVNNAWRDVIYKGNDNYFLEATSDRSSTPAGGGTFGSVNMQTYGTSALTRNAWTHLAVTYDGANLKLYVNGSQVSSVARTGNIATSTDPLQIGGDSIYGQYFAGRVDDVRVYNRALTAGEIQTDMNTPVDGASSDTEAPTAPGDLSAAAVSASQINLAWTAATDNVAVTSYLVERCQNAGCSNFTQIATPTDLSYNNAGLAAGATYNYRVRATDAAGNLSSYSNTATARTSSAGDTQPPTVSLTAPAANTTVSNNVTVSANASDDVGLAGVQFLLDGANLGAEDTVAPYSISWDSTTAGNGAHALSARARDAAGNETTATPINVTVDNPSGDGTPFSVDPASATKYGVHEIVLSGNGSVSNPFNTIATVVFTPPSGSADAVTVRAFYDGGNTWRARVYVKEVGTWRWSSTSATDAGLNNKSGSFAALNSTLRGMLKKNPSNPKAWQTEDGRWYVSISDTAWYLFHQEESLWQQYVQDDVARGMNSLGPSGALGSPFVGPDTWGATGHSTGNDPWVGATNHDYARYDLTKFQTTDTRLAWIFNNYPDVYIRSLLFGTEMQSNWNGLSQTVRNNTLDYMIARWSAFPNLYWLISDDQNVTSNATLAFNREVGNYFASHEPWKHLMSTQVSRFQGFPFTTPSDLNWVGWANLQDSDSSNADQIAQYRLTNVALQPIFGEDYYEQDYGGPPSGYSDPTFYMRWKYWTWIFSGGAYTFGGRCCVLHPYSQTGDPKLKWIGSGDVDYTGYALHGLDTTAYIGSYFKNRNIDLSSFQNNDSLVTSWAMRTGDSWNPKLMRRGNQEFLVYDPNAFSEGPYADVDSGQAARMTINLGSAAGTFNVEWFRPADGLVATGGTVSGGASRSFTAPWVGYDVVLRLTLAP